MKSIFNIVIISLFSISTVIAGTKGGTIEEKLALEAQRAEAQKENISKKISIQDSKVCINKTSPIIIDSRDYMKVLKVNSHQQVGHMNPTPVILGN